MLPHRKASKGPLIAYILDLKNLKQDRLAADVVQAVRSTMGTAEGRIVMELLEKTTIQAATPIDAPPGALAARNAQSFIAHDLRRIMSDEFDAIARMENETHTRSR